MSETERFGGFLDHMEKNLGVLSGVIPPDFGGRNRGYAVGWCDTSDGDLTSAFTNGLRFQQVTAILPQELVCTLNADQRTAAAHVVSLAADQVMEHGYGLMLDQVIRGDGPLVPDTRMYGVVVVPHPYLEDDFDTLIGADGEAEMQILTVVPVTRAELDLIDRQGVEALYELWEQRETDLSDIHRASV